MSRRSCRRSAAPPWSRSTPRTSPGLFYRIAGRDQPRRRQHHRRAHPHHRRRHGARQFPGPGRPPRPLRRSAPARAAEGRGDAARWPATSRRPTGSRRGRCRCAAPRPSAIQPAVFVDNKASNRYTVVEVNARDRAALLFELARAIYVSRAIDPQRPCRHLWRARRRRLLSDRPRAARRSRARRG